MRDQPHALPRPGPRWGNCPLRSDDEAGGLSARGLDPRIWPALPAWLPASWMHAWHRPWLRTVRARIAQHRLQAGPASSTAAFDALAADTRLTLRREGLTRDALVQGLALVSLAIERAFDKRPHDTQLMAAAMLLDQRGAEMATGEGKTLAMAMAASVAALAGVPVHVVTANDYLAERDARDLQALWSLLGLRTAHIAPGQTPAQRREVYAQDIVYATGKELAFDHLRDGLAQAGSGHETPVMRGLCLALLDEADSILLDEAVVPLIISAQVRETPAHTAQRRALWWQAWQLSQALQAPDDFVPEPHGKGVHLTQAGQARLAELAAPLKGVWRRARLREEMMRLALSARHTLHLDQHYLLRDQSVHLLDTLTGRVAVGRVWSQGLQTLVELKEGCPPSPATHTLAQITFQRFFQRYWRLGAISGTLMEARAELAAVHGLPVRRVPTRLPSRRQTWPTRLFDTEEARWQAAAERAAVLQAQGRPVLIGTDCVRDSEQLSAHLTRAGVAHTVLNARQDAQEAAIVAQAGQPGRVTVSTRMAGRGTDIHLDERALAAGGLHIIHCQRNESPRMDRQLLGRCARQGQTGSTETWLCAVLSGERPSTPPHKLLRWTSIATCALPARSILMARLRLTLHQWAQSQRQAALRLMLLEQDREWERQRQLARRSGWPPA